MSICRCVMFFALFLYGISLHAAPLTEVHAQDPLKNRKPDCWQQSPAAEPAGEEVEILDDV